MAGTGSLQTYKQGDTLPAFRAQLRDVVNGVEVAKDLTLATSAKLLLRGPATLSAALTIEAPPTGGWVNRPWGVNDLATIGNYDVEVEVTWSGGGKQTFPPHGYGLIVVTDDLG